MVNTLKRSADDFSSAVDRRARLHRRARLVVLAAVVGYFFLPYEVKAVIPVWLLFIAALGLEVEFFVGGWLQARQERRPGRSTAARNRGISRSSARSTTSSSRSACSRPTGTARRRRRRRIASGATSPRQPWASRLWR